MSTKPMSLKNNILRASLLFAVLAVSFAALFSLLGSFNLYGKTYSLSDGWRLYADGVLYDNVSPDDIFSVTNKHMQALDSIYIERDLSDIPEEIENPAVTITLYYSSAVLYIDGEKIGELQTGRMQRENYAGCGTYYVELPDDYDKHTLGITYTFSQNDSSPNLSVPKIASYRTLFLLYLRQRSVTLACCFL